MLHSFFLPKEMNSIECEHFHNCLVRKFTQGLCVLETLGTSRAHTICHIFTYCFSKASASVHQTCQEKESKGGQDTDSHSRSRSGNGL